MKKTISVCLAFLLGGFVAMGASGQAAKSVPSVAALRSIRVNAEDAGKNAAIYQWMRVNREVDRVVASERTVTKASASNASVQSLQSAVRALRTARLAHDVAGIQQAAQQVVAACDALLK